jgi:hypothetical protein
VRALQQELGVVAIGVVDDATVTVINAKLSKRKLPSRQGPRRRRENDTSR